MIFFYKKKINVYKRTKKKKKQQKVLPVNCNRMMTAGACPLTFWTVIIYKLKGYKVRGWPTCGSWAILRTFPPNSEVVCVSKLSPITLQPKKKSRAGWFCTQLSLCWADQCFCHWTLSPVTLNVIYALYATWTCIGVCMCVCMCACILLYRMCFLASGLALSPAPWLAYAPVMSQRTQR